MDIVVNKHAGAGVIRLQVMAHRMTLLYWLEHASLVRTKLLNVNPGAWGFRALITANAENWQFRFFGVAHVLCLEDETVTVTGRLKGLHV